MIEILMFWYLTGRFGKVVERKGYRAGWFKVLTVVLVLGGMISGALVGMTTGVFVERSGPATSGYVCLFWLMGALVGAGANLAIATLVPPSSTMRWLLNQDSLVESALLNNIPHEIYLKGADLQEANIQGKHLREANLQRADVRDADMRRANLEKANLSEADLTGANMEWANLQQADLSGAKVIAANMSAANMKAAVLDEADLQRASLDRADLRAANLVDANLQEASLEGTVFNRETILPDDTHWSENDDLTRFTNSEHPEFWRSEEVHSPAYIGTGRGLFVESQGSGSYPHSMPLGSGALAIEYRPEFKAVIGHEAQQGDIQDADMSNADMRKIDLRKANLDNANLRNALLRESDLTGASLTEADLRNSDLQDALLSEANLQLADLSGANLQDADLDRANLEGAKLDGVNLRNTDMFEANLLDVSMLLAEFNENTVLPDEESWSSTVNMARFTDAEHPEFWRSDNDQSPAFGGYNFE